MKRNVQPLFFTGRKEFFAERISIETQRN